MRKYYLFLNNFRDTECANSVRLHSVTIAHPVPEINSALKLGDATQLIKVTRIFKEDEGVVVLTKSYFSAELFSGLLQVPHRRFEKVPLFVIVEEDYNLRLNHTDELLTLRPPRAGDAELLDSSRSGPVLFMKSLTYSTRSDIPHEYRESFCKLGGKYMYRCIDYS
ncbi:MAG: UTRA domain-containing protein [Desulfovibrio sp.]|nr:UTRA domain-containing protein [Desulfovibrio sp.]